MHAQPTYLTTKRLYALDQMLLAGMRSDDYTLPDAYMAIVNSARAEILKLAKALQDQENKDWEEQQ